MHCKDCKYHIKENKLVDKVKDFLGIHSPSKVFAGESGEYVCTNPDSDYLGIATDNKDFCGGYDGNIHNENTQRRTCDLPE